MHWMINAWIKGNNKKRQYNVWNMKFPASEFNEKNVFMQFQKKKILRCQLYAQAYVRIWTLRPWLRKEITPKPCYTSKISIRYS